MIVRFLVKLTRLAPPGVINSRGKTLRRKFPAIDHQFPRPLDRFLFEIVAETPVAEHFEESVVIRVEPDIFEIVVLAASANAFLGIGHARRVPRWFLLAEKDRHELVHARVSEKQIGRIGQQRRRRHDGVLFLAKEIEKRLSDLRRGHEGKNDECQMPNAELMTKSEAKKQSPRSNASSFELRDSFVIRNSCFVISNFVDLTMGKLPKLA